MYFDYSDENKMVQSSVKAMFKKHVSTEVVREFMSHSIIPKELVELLAKQGLLGVLDTTLEIGEKGIETAVLIAYEAGYSLLPFPLIETLIGLNVLRKSDENNEIVSTIEDGERILTIAWENEHAQVIEQNGTYILNGILREVPFAGNSDYILAKVPFRGTGDTPAEEETLIMIETKDQNVKIKQVGVMDETYPLYEVYLNSYELTKKSIIQEIGFGEKLFTEMFNLGAILITSEIIGCSERALFEAIDYTKYRKQFGVEIGKFQALKHMGAEMHLKFESSKLALQYASWSLENNQDDSNLAISIAKSYASEAVFDITSKAIQILGGIGFTWENDLHLFFKRAQRGSSLFGGKYYHREKIAQSIY